MVGDRDHIGIQGLHFCGAGGRASQHVEKVFGMTRLRVRRDGRLALRSAAKGRREDGGGAGEADVIGFGTLACLVAQEREARAEPFRDAAAAAKGEKARDQEESSRAGPAHGDTDFLFRGCGIEARRCPEGGCGALETMARGEVLHFIASNDQPAGLAIDMAEAGFGGHHIVEAAGAGGTGIGTHDLTPLLGPARKGP